MKGFKELTLFRFYLMAGASVIMGTGMFACSDDDAGAPKPIEPEIPTLHNQIQVGDAPAVKLQSAISDVDETGSYTYYLSASAGLTTLNQMAAADANPLTITLGKEVHGVIDTGKDTYKVTYGDFEISKATASQYSRLSLTVNPLADGCVEIGLAAEKITGEKLYANYSDPCPQAAGEPVENAFQVGKEAVRAIARVVETRTATVDGEQYRVFELYDSAEAAEAALTIRVPYEIVGKENSNLEGVVKGDEGFKIEGAFETVGKIIENTTTKVSINDDGTMSVDLVAVGSDGKREHLKLDSKNATEVSYGVESPDFTVGSGKAVSLTKLFVWKNEVSKSSVFMFGDQGELAPAEYPKHQEAVNAVKIVVPDELLTASVDMAGNESVRVDLFNYKDYTTLTNAPGTARSSNLKGGSKLYYNKVGDNVFVIFDITFDNDTKIVGTWYGPIDEVLGETAPDMTPIEPFKPRIHVLTDKDTRAEFTNFPQDIDKITIRHDNNYSGGALGVQDVYVIYFYPTIASLPDGANEHSLDGAPDSNYYIPRISFDPKLLNVDGGMDIGKEITDFYWDFTYEPTNINDIMGGYSYKTWGISDYNKYTFRSPDEGSLEVKQNEDKTFTLKFFMHVYGVTNKSYSGDYTYSGSKKYIEIEVRNFKASKYDFNKPNLGDIVLE